MLYNKNIDNFTTDEPIIKNPCFTTENLFKIREEIAKSFYNSKNYEARMNNKIKKFPFLRHSYDEFFEFLTKKRII